jgi:hypothetical protein
MPSPVSPSGFGLALATLGFHLRAFHALTCFTFGFRVGLGHFRVSSSEALPKTRPEKTSSPQKSRNLQSSLKATKSVQKHEAFLPDTKKKYEKKVKNPISEFVFSHREVAMVAISCLSLLVSTFGCFTFGFFWACLLFASELRLSWAPLVFSSGFQTLNDNLVGFQNPKWFQQRVFKTLNHNLVGFPNPKWFQQRVFKTLSTIFQTSGPP